MCFFDIYTLFLHLHKNSYIKKQMQSEHYFSFCIYLITLRKVLKSITVDNGSEFNDWRGMEQSCRNKNKKRTKLYYCHPYSSWERGSNEVANRMIRRIIPKGTNFDKITRTKVKAIADWMSDYPREIFGFESDRQRFEYELEMIS